MIKSKVDMLSSVQINPISTGYYYIVYIIHILYMYYTKISTVSIKMLSVPFLKYFDTVE